MITPLLNGLAKEKVMLLEPSKVVKLSLLLGGIVRIVDRKGHTLGLFIDKEFLDEIEEDRESSSSEFLASLDVSRKSGRISSKEVKKKAGLK